MEAKIEFEPDLSWGIEVSHNGQQWFPAKYVATIDGDVKAPYIARRTDMKAEHLNTFAHMRQDDKRFVMYTIIDDVKYRLVAVPTK